MMQAVPNSGIFSDDTLDRLRGDAIAASQDGLPEAVVYYLRALEIRYLEMQREQKRRALIEIGWKFHDSDQGTGGAKNSAREVAA